MLLTLAIVVPLALAPMLCAPRVRAVAMGLAPWAALPALALAVWGEPGTSTDLEWLLLGARVGLDGTGRVFLLFTSILWTAAGAYARAYLAADAHRHRFMTFFLLTMAGNLGLIVAGDMLTFYVCFAVMSFASYPLVIHAGDPAALFAGRVYIVLVIVGELLLFTGIMATAALAGRVDLAGAPAAVAVSPSGAIVMGLLLAGFGIKAGALPLHVWLPLAHPAAPTPASAVLSGALIKAGLIGWLRFLPLGEMALPVFGLWCVAGGLAAAFGGVLAGVTQINVKSALAYSSISQMGLLTVGLGAGLIAPDAWPALLPALLLYAMHHGLAKGALFLGVGVAAAAAGGPPRLRRLVLVGLALPALALAGVPLTSGAGAKVALKTALDAAGQPLAAVAPWLGTLDVWLSWAAVGTTLLMARALVLLTSPDPGAHGRLRVGILVPWVALIGVVAVFIWTPVAGVRESAARALAPAYLWSTLWPPLAGAAVAWMAWSHPAVGVWRPRLHVPAGDVLWPALSVGRAMIRLTGAVPAGVMIGWVADALRTLSHVRPATRDRALRFERVLALWGTAGVLLLAIAAAFLVLFALG